MKLSITRKIYLGFGLALALLLGVVVMAIRSQREFMVDNALIGHTHEVLAELESIPALTAAAESSRRGFILTRDERLLASYEAAAAQLPRKLQTVRRLTADDPAQQPRLDRLEPIVGQKLAQLRESIALRRQGGDDAARQIAITLEGASLVESIRELSAALVQEERALLNERSARSESRARLTESFLVLTGVLGILAVWFAGTRVRRDIAERDQAKTALLKSEEQFRCLFEAAPDGVIMVNERGLITRTNAQAEKMFGYRREELSGQHIGVLMPEHLREAYEKHRQTFQAAPRLRAMGSDRDLAARRKDGSEFSADIMLNPVQTEEGQAVIAAVRDVTERKRAEERLRQSEEFNRRITGSSYDCIKVLDLDANLLSMSESGQRLLGITDITPYLNHCWVEFWQEADRARVREAVAAARAGNIGRFQAYFPVTTGESRWWDVVLTAIRGTAGQPRQLLSISRDITERKQAEERLRTSERLYSSLVENLPQSIFRKDREGRFTFVNEQFCRLLDRKPEDLLGRTDAELFPAALAAKYRADDLQVMASGKMFDQVEELESANGRMQVHVLKTALRGEGGEVVGIQGIFHDVTQEKRIEEELRQAQKLESIGLLAGGIAHDFNNLLGVIIMQAELTELAGAMAPEVRESVEEIKSAARRAAGLTQQLLLFSRKQIVQKRTLDLNEQVKNVAKLLQRLIREDVVLELNLGAGPLAVHADPAMLDQVLINFAVNARDAMPKGGKLLIETAEKWIDEDQARLKTEPSAGRYVGLSVSDTGGGIPPNILPRIFEPFFTTKEPGKGTGLGLATVFGIVKQHGGWVKVYSEPDRGSNFQIYLPAVAANVLDLTPVANPLPRGGNETVLLVEDDLNLRQSTCLTLRQHGYRVLEAANAPEALNIWREHRDAIEVVMTDLVMPGGVTGREFAAQLRAARPKLQVILTSGYSADIVEGTLAIEPGECFLPKPYSLRELLEALWACFDSKTDNRIQGYDQQSSSSRKQRADFTG
ncbi:MAG: PAS domain S-box protein [Verrucomicrobia bacterium]|nr:PAS domain S-box protein [Verrucomicrobiota bacterium]